MTREEYLQLVNRSASFKAMDPTTQQKVLHAEEEEMQKYIQIFSEENAFIQKAAQNLTQKNEQVLKNFDQQVKQINHDHLIVAEKSSQEADEKAAENLLNNL